MRHLYGTFSHKQIAKTKKSLRGSIFFLLLCVDPETSQEYKDVDVNKCFRGLLLKMGGMNHLLREPPELVMVMSLLQAAWDEYISSEYDFTTYRKLILDAGAEVEKIDQQYEQQNKDIQYVSKSEGV